MRLPERPPARGASIAALAPHKIGDAPGDRQVAHPHPGAILDTERRAPAARAAAGARGQLDLEVEPTALAVTSRLAQDAGVLLPASATPLNESSQQTADALQDATQQPEDAGQEATYRTAETAKNSHLNSSRAPEVPVPETSHRTLDESLVSDVSLW
jgi:hypothetical protein